MVDPAFTNVVQSIRLAAEPEEVWNALIDPRAGEKWRNADFDTDWAVGSPIGIGAVIGGERYKDKGRILRADPPSLLQYAYWSRVSGLPDVPQSYSTVTIRLEADGGETILTVEQMTPPSPVRRGEDWEIGPDSGWKHVAFYWRTTLPILKRVVEDDRRSRPEAGAN
jgi:uncharacterized protein YndB with AHSA1/START domain